MTGSRPARTPRAVIDKDLFEYRLGKQHISDAVMPVTFGRATPRRDQRRPLQRAGRLFRRSGILLGRQERFAKGLGPVLHGASLLFETDGHPLKSPGLLQQGVGLRD